MDPQSAKKGGEIGDRGGISPLPPPLYDTLLWYYSYSGHTGTCWGIPLGDPRVMPRYYGTIVTRGILVHAGVYLWVTHGVMPRYYGTIVTLGVLVHAGVYLWVTHGSCLDTMVL